MTKIIYYFIIITDNRLKIILDVKNTLFSKTNNKLLESTQKKNRRQRCEISNLADGPLLQEVHFTDHVSLRKKQRCVHTNYPGIKLNRARGEPGYSMDIFEF